MKLELLLFISFMTLVSCSTVNNFKHRMLGFNSDNFIEKGKSEAEVTAHIGAPRIQAQLSDKKYLFFDTGFVTIQDSKVFEIEPYNVTYTDEYKFSSYVPIGSAPSTIFKSLGFPQEVREIAEKHYFRYNNGAILFENNKVVKVVDKLFKDDVTFIVNLSSFSDFSAQQGSKYFIAPGSANISPNDFQFKELKNYITQAIVKEGMMVVSEMSKADYILLVNFGISDPKENIAIVSRAVFVPTYTPGQTTNIYGAYGKQLGSIQTNGQWGSQYAGQQTETIKTISFNRWLNVEAIDFRIWKQSNEQVPVWKILTSSEGPSGDLRLVMPALTLGIQSYINKDSGSQISLKAMPATLNNYVYETRLLGHR